MAVGPDVFPDMPNLSGLKISVLEAGIKYASRKDLVMFSADKGARIAGVFTRNAFCAAPVHIAKAHLEFVQQSQSPFCLLINTGNANAGTGKQGFDDAQACCEAIAGVTPLQVKSVLPFSTGVIGEPLPKDKIVNASADLLDRLGASTWRDAATGIMTTDTRPKGASRQVVYGAQTITINGVSKGAGMIKPNMATMLCFIATDADIPQDLLNTLSSELSERSFNRITVDGDTSTNDACMLIATGAVSKEPIDIAHPDFVAFRSALESVYLELAHAIVRDGEGATKFVTVEVSNAKDSAEALEVAYTIAHSPLVKTALFASDPNWGRILAALGRANIDNLDLDAIRIHLGDVLLVENGGRASSYQESAGQAVMNGEDITIAIDLARGSASERVWTTDLSHEYVTINAEYRT